MPGSTGTIAPIRPATINAAPMADNRRSIRNGTVNADADDAHRGNARARDSAARADANACESFQAPRAARAGVDGGHRAYVRVRARAVRVRAGVRGVR